MPMTDTSKNFVGFTQGLRAISIACFSCSMNSVTTLRRNGKPENRREVNKNGLNIKARRVNRSYLLVWRHANILVTQNRLILHASPVYGHFSVSSSDPSLTVDLLHSFFPEYESYT